MKVLCFTKKTEDENYTTMVQRGKVLEDGIIASVPDSLDGCNKSEPPQVPDLLS